MNITPTICFVACMIIPTLGTAQDVANGEALFRKCAVCHKVGEEAKNGVGPVLTDVIGRAAGTFKGYKYSKALVAAGEKGLVWDATIVSEYIADPRKFMRAFLDDPKAKPKMTFKLKSESDRTDVAAYLVSLGSNDLEKSRLTVPKRAIELAQVPDSICVMNGSEEAFFFTVENAEGDRKFARLQGDEYLCSDSAKAGSTGTVSVFESADAFEGCSRRILVGQIETMFRYSEFDRCEWSSNQS